MLNIEYRFSRHSRDENIFPKQVLMLNERRITWSLLCSNILRWFQNLPSGQISALGRAVQSSKYVQYSCGWPTRPALTFGLIEGFETTSSDWGFFIHAYMITIPDKK